MLNLGLSAADKRAYENTLRQSHRMRVTVRIHDRDEKILHTFEGSILSGSVQVDMSNTPSMLGFAAGSSGGNSPIRTLDLTVLLPRKDQAWLPDAPGSESVFANNFISVRRGVWVENFSTGARWIDVPVFWGPITGIDRDGDQVTIRGAGKEVLAMDPVLLWKTLKVYKGDYRAGAIRWLLANMGETRFDFPEFRNKLTNTWSLGRHTEAWVAASSLARYGGWQLFYDGLGRARLRPYPQNRVFTFSSGNNGVLLSKPKVSYDISSARNVVEITGTPTKGKKPKQIRVEARPNTGHPLSPWSLRRNGYRRNMVHVEQGAEFATQADAQRQADRLLDQMLNATTQIEFDSLVIPHLEEGDRVAVKVGTTYATGPERDLEGSFYEFSLLRFTIPLVAGEPMSVGVNRRVSWRRRGRTPIYRWSR